MQYPDKFDVIVVGGGHAGTEAALACARMGSNTVLITQNIETIGQMSCNPAIGGIGKGHIVKEIDALGGVMARAIDKGGIQFRILNSRKGPAVRATRAQADRVLYKQAVRTVVEHQSNLTLFQQSVDDLIINQNSVIGVKTQMGVEFYAQAVVLTTGTFLGGKIHVGDQQFAGGRAGDSPSNALANRLRELPFRVERLKTGTPPRIDGKSINFTKLESQPGDHPLPSFSFLGTADDHPRQIDCHITYTNENTHEIIRANINRSAMYSGNIEGVGPRYCPSIEDKVVRFADKDSHQIFIEPEGLDTTEIYPNGISTSLPFEVQIDYVRSIAGFEQAVITRPGYAIEYDFFDPRDLRPTLETKYLDGLYFAGQINGTTGYEEAAGQGLIAGLNASLKINGLSAWVPRRDEGYIGVMIDDLITRGTKEPYRMFTSRAEYRLMLREDNADLRLTEKGRELGLVGDYRWQAFNKKQQAIASEQLRLDCTFIRPDNANHRLIENVLGQPLKNEIRMSELLKRPEVSYAQMLQLPGAGIGVGDEKVAQQVEIQAKYSGYIERQKNEIEKHQRSEQMRLPENLDYSKVKGLSAEVSQKLIQQKPSSIGQASRIPGVTPAAISLLLVYLKKRNIKAA